MGIRVVSSVAERGEMVRKELSDFRRGRKSFGRLNGKIGKKGRPIETTPLLRGFFRLFHRTRRSGCSPAEPYPPVMQEDDKDCMGLGQQ